MWTSTRSLEPTLRPWALPSSFLSRSPEASLREQRPEVTTTGSRSKVDEEGSHLDSSDHKNLGRNAPCHCGSGKKYKNCCLGKDEAAGRETRTKAAEEAAAQEPAEPAKSASAAVPRPKTRQPWKGHTNTRGFQKVSAPRKV